MRLLVNHSGQNLFASIYTVSKWDSTIASPRKLGRHSAMQTYQPPRSESKSFLVLIAVKKEKLSCYCSSRFRGKRHALYSDFNDSQIRDLKKCRDMPT